MQLLVISSVNALFTGFSIVMGRISPFSLRAKSAVLTDPAAAYRIIMVRTMLKGNCEHQIDAMGYPLAISVFSADFHHSRLVHCCFDPIPFRR